MHASMKNLAQVLKGQKLNELMTNRFAAPGKPGRLFCGRLKSSEYLKIGSSNLSPLAVVIYRLPSPLLPCKMQRMEGALLRLRQPTRMAYCTRVFWLLRDKDDRESFVISASWILGFYGFWSCDSGRLFHL